MIVKKWRFAKVAKVEQWALGYFPTFPFRFIARQVLLDRCGIRTDLERKCYNIRYTRCQVAKSAPARINSVIGGATTGPEGRVHTPRHNGSHAVIGLLTRCRLSLLVSLGMTGMGIFTRHRLIAVGNLLTQGHASPRCRS